MKHLVLAAAMLTLCLTNATGQAKLLTGDPLTGLPLIPATDSGKHMDGISYIYNDPQKCRTPKSARANSKAISILYSTSRWTQR